MGVIFTSNRRIEVLVVVQRIGIRAFEIMPADRCEEVHSASLDMVHMQQTGGDARHDSTKATLSLDEWAVTETPAVGHQRVEGAKVRRLPPEQQVLEVAAAVGIEAHDLAVQNRLVGTDSVRDLLRELPEPREDVTVS
jgi:hypothetical protein